MNFLANLSFVFSAFLALVFIVFFIAYLRNYAQLSRAMDSGSNALLKTLARLERDHLVSVMAVPVCGSFLLSLALLILGLLFKVFA